MVRWMIVCLILILPRGVWADGNTIDGKDSFTPNCWRITNLSDPPLVAGDTVRIEHDGQALGTAVVQSLQAGQAIIAIRGTLSSTPQSGDAVVFVAHRGDSSPAVSSSAAPASVSADVDEARKQIEALLQQASTATQDKDVEGIFKNCTPDCTFVNGENKQTLEQAKAAMRRVLPSIEKIENSAAVTDCRLAGNLALVTRTGTSNNHAGGHVTRIEGTFEDVWIRTPQGWRCKSIRVVSSRTFLDGQPRP